MFGLPPNADISSHFTAGVTTNGNWRSCAALSLARLAIPSRRRLKSGDGLIAGELSLMVAFQMVRLFDAARLRSAVHPSTVELRGLADLRSLSRAEAFCANSLLGAQHLQQRLRLFQIANVETFGERKPAQAVRALAAPCPGHASRGWAVFWSLQQRLVGQGYVWLVR